MSWTEILQGVRHDQGRFDRHVAGTIEEFTRRGGQIHCARGCRNCCNLVVNASLPEAALVAECLSSRQRQALRGHVARLREALAGIDDLKDYLRIHRRLVGYCPFLESDGSCGVYAARPFSCRALLATRNSDWCAVDFSDLHPHERQAFMSGLDRSAVAFPTHYLASPQSVGLNFEQRSADAMKEHFGFSLRGNLTVQVALLIDHDLAAILDLGLEKTRQAVSDAFLLHPLLVEFS